MTVTIFHECSFISHNDIQIYIYAFSRCFYPKRLAVHSGYNFFSSMCVPWIEPTTFCAANAMLYHWATGTLHYNFISHNVTLYHTTATLFLMIFLINVALYILHYTMCDYLTSSILETAMSPHYTLYLTITSFSYERNFLIIASLLLTIQKYFIHCISVFLMNVTIYITIT